LGLVAQKTAEQQPPAHQAQIVFFLQLLQQAAVMVAVGVALHLTKMADWVVRVAAAVSQ